FVGRAAVLAEAGAVVAGARAGRGGLVLLTGAGGAGKTRLAAEIAAAAADFRTVWVWCPPGGGAAGLGPWTQVLRGRGGAPVRGRGARPRRRPRGAGPGPGAGGPARPGPVPAGRAAARGRRRRARDRGRRAPGHRRGGHLDRGPHRRRSLLRHRARAPWPRH